MSNHTLSRIVSLALAIAGAPALAEPDRAE